jgi:hypothetical protein
MAAMRGERAAAWLEDAGTPGLKRAGATPQGLFCQSKRICCGYLIQGCINFFKQLVYLCPLSL